MSLSELPNELIQLIADSFVLHCDINAFCQASRRLYSLLNPFLYFCNARYSDSAALPLLCHRGYTSLVRMMLDAGAPLDACGDQYYHQMGLAAAAGHAEIVELFLQRDVPASGDIVWPNYIYDWDVGPGISAVWHEPVLRVMSAYDIDLSDPLLLCSAARGPSLAAVKFLAGLISGLNGGEASELPTPLEDAATEGDIEAVRFLIDAGADPNGGDNGRMLTPICSAAGRGHMDITRMLLAHGADIKVPTSSGRSTFLPLILAAIRGHVEIAKLLLKHIDLTVGEASQGLLLTTGAACGLKTLVAQILLQDCDPDELCWDLQIFRHEAVCTPLRWAATYGHTEIIELLLNYGADPNGGQNSYILQRPLFGAIDGGHENAVQVLLDKGANPDVGEVASSQRRRSTAGRNREFLSIYHVHLDDIGIRELGCSRVAAEALLDNGLPLTVAMLREHSFKNVVEHAAQGGVEMLKLFAMRGIFSELQDEESEKSILRTAGFKGNTDIIEFFLRDRGFGSDLNLLRFLVMIAVIGSCHGQETVAALDLIISYGVDLNTLTDGDTTVPFLSMMIAQKRPEQVRILLERGASPLVKSYHSRSALEEAIIGANIKIVRALLQALDSRWITLRDCEHALGRAEAFADMQGNDLIKEHLRNFYWKKKYPVPL